MFDVFFKLAPALSVLFELGYELKESFFYELTADQYDKIAEAGEDISIKWYMLISENSKQNVSHSLIVTEDEKRSLLEAADYINNTCQDSGETFNDFSAKLRYVANISPPVLTKGDSKFGKRAHLKIIK